MKTPDPVVRACLIIMAVVVGAGGLVYARSVLIPFAIALFITYILMPLVNLLEDRLKAPRWLAVSGTLLLTALILIGLGTMVSKNIVSMAANIQDYQQKFAGMVARLQPLAEQAGLGAAGLDGKALLSGLKPALGFVSSFSKSVLDLLSDTFLIIIFVLFLISGERIAMPDHSMVRESNKRIRSYLVTKVSTSLTTGILTALILALCGIDLAMFFGLLAFCLNFIPTIGSIVAVILPIPVILISAGSVGAGITAFAGPLVVQFLIGNILEPRIMGDNLDLHPVTLLLALMFWGLLWGIPGRLK